MSHGKRTFAILLGCTALLAVVAASIDPLTLPMPGYMENIREWATRGTIADTFTPLAYPLFAGLGYKCAGIPGLLAVQALLHVAIAATAFAILRRLRLPPVWCALGAVPLVLHPDLLTSVAKTWDVALSTELYLLIALTLLHFIPSLLEPQTSNLDRNPRPALHAALAGLALGAGMSSRPNFLLLVPLLAWTAYRYSSGTTKRRGLTAGGLLTCAAIAFLALGAAEHGRPFFPGNGPYNLYAGHNAFTAHTLLNQENAEPSIVSAYRAAMQADPALPRLSENSGDYYAASLKPFYTHTAIIFAARHPAEELKLVAIKLATLFRPDTKVHPLGSPAGLAKAALGLPIVFLAAALLWPKRQQLQAADRALLMLDALYILPFLLTNADPRFRTPLDALMLLQCVRLLWLRHLRNSTNPGAPSSSASPR